MFGNYKRLVVLFHELLNGRLWLSPSTSQATDHTYRSTARPLSNGERNARAQHSEQRRDHDDQQQQSDRDVTLRPWKMLVNIETLFEKASAGKTLYNAGYERGNEHHILIS